MDRRSNAFKPTIWREVQKLVATSARSPNWTSDSKRASETSSSKCTKSSVIERLVSEKAKNLIKREDF